jgi:transcriptional regulator GlxA family with amidase domain
LGAGLPPPDPEVSLEEVAAAAGFDGAAALRDRFRRSVGVSPRAYRRSLGTPAGLATA